MRQKGARQIASEKVLRFEGIDWSGSRAPVGRHGSHHRPRHGGALPEKGLPGLVCYVIEDAGRAQQGEQRGGFREARGCEGAQRVQGAPSDEGQQWRRP